MSTVSEKFVDGFHKHLDECAQCRENPMSLCDVGGLLLACSATARQVVQPKGSHPFDVFEKKEFAA